MRLLKTSRFLVGLLYRLLSTNNVNNDSFFGYLVELGVVFYLVI